MTTPSWRKRIWSVSWITRCAAVLDRLITLSNASIAEDPLVLAIEDLEGRVVSALDQMQLHPGTRSSTTTTVHEELGVLLRPVVEIAAHTAPSIARTYYRQDIDDTMDQVYERPISDLILPTILEIAQSDNSPAKRAATLEFFRQVWQESVTVAPQA